MTKTQVAQRIGVDLRAVSAYEAGEYAPDDERLAALSEVLRFPREFFFGEDVEEPSPDVASFRALSRMSAGLRDMALGSGAVALMLNAWIEDRFDLPRCRLPDLSQDADPEAAAEMLRAAWGLGQLPIRNMVHLLESKGVRVYSLSLDSLKVDAFSMWRQDTPFVFLNTRKTSEHSRFDAAHELGHLVMHRHGSPQGHVTEREANAFASAFLMPRGTVLAKAPSLATVDQLVRLKKQWNVSVAALAYRMHALGILSDWHHRSLYIEISKRGYRKAEPLEAPRESSQVLAKVLATLREDGFTKEAIAAELLVSVSEIEDLVFGLTITGVASSGGVRFPSRRTVNLKVVGSH